MTTTKNHLRTRRYFPQNKRECFHIGIIKNAMIILQAEIYHKTWCYAACGIQVIRFEKHYKTKQFNYVNNTVSVCISPIKFSWKCSDLYTYNLKPISELSFSKQSFYHGEYLNCIFFFNATSS